MASSKHPLPTVAALITGPSGRVLLVRTTKWRGLWGIPGGKVEWGEPLEAALRREIREEVGLELQGVRLARVQEAILDPQFHKPAHFVLLNYYAQSQSEAVRPNEEIAEWAWIRPEEGLHYPLNTFTRVLLQDYLACGDGAFSVRV
ncbi:MULTISPECIES: NUDIX domain-containing protein [unclassified Meiothermus]|uniref:NUDIX domain-containing protein n=1 Tax=unclassified Meiothermus TaxID=370471 RepID=UPI000D7D1EF2|nr:MULTISPECIES: NUDIX domain-containing protein [unclassified Meiothermus]PZA06401.1 DNA mismatch repair protein MutT [Meiothermus sp. Pnk-1]RYM36980.1 NUDIX domain-containing protein [Meiothermus sp. PNK-Is4]